MSESSPVRTVDVRQLKTQAKDLRRAAHAQEPQALTRIRAHHPKYSEVGPESLPDLSLQDTQLVIAREHGYASWPRLTEAASVVPSVDGNGGIDGIDGIVGSSLKDLRGLLHRSLSVRPAPALITGEPGTGKRFVARALADQTASELREVDCRANPDCLGESLIFGYQAGAFTGAHQDTPGVLESCHGGIVLLTEADHLSPRAQAWLAEALDTGSYRRLGSQESLPFGVRLACTSTSDLKSLVDEGRFREDLYHHVQVIRVVLPSLRDRRTDIPELAQYFVQALRPQARLTDEAIAKLQAHDWPGNLRELRHVVEAAALASEVEAIDAVSIALLSSSAAGRAA